MKKEKKKKKSGIEDQDRGSKISPITLLTETLCDTVGLKTHTQS